MRELAVGDIVKLKVDCLGNSQGDIGVVINKYQGGVQVIFANGEYDGFSDEEQKKMLERTGHDSYLENYQFTNVMQLTKDYNLGAFDDVFV